MDMAKAVNATFTLALTLADGPSTIVFGDGTDFIIAIQNPTGNPLAGVVSASGAFSVMAGGSLDVPAGGSRPVWIRASRNGAGLVAGDLTFTTASGILRRVLVAGAFTDSNPTPGSTTVKLAHLLELRALIDALRERQGLAAFAWTDPNPVAGVTPVRRQHLMELRSALATVYIALERTPPAFSDTTVASNVTTIKASHLSELRIAAQALQ
jgi:hypothetical protein